MSYHAAARLQRKLTATSPTETYLSWGRYPRATHIYVHRPAWNDQVPEILAAAAPGSILPYGLGRSYGDSCLNAGRQLVDCKRLDRILAFDASTGILRCEGGVTLSEIIDIFLPQGWFVPVTPGTRFITIGGAIANDVHGKNHHCAGSFGAHVQRLALHRSGDGLVLCSPQENPQMFSATIGGLGLTGIIAWADIQLKRVAGPWIDVETVPFEFLESFRDLSRESDGRFEYTVAWLDCFAGSKARGIFFRGNHSAEGGIAFRRGKRWPNVSFPLPTWTLNHHVIRACNHLYYHRCTARKGPTIASYESFLYPLDLIPRWNLLYGKHGFLQYQCVIPEENFAAMEELLDRVAHAGMGSFLCVLKQFGSAAPAGLLSFPRPGFTLALDFPMRGERTLGLLHSLDEIVQRSGGALYPAKDARMSPALFKASFPKWRSFAACVDRKISSSFWRRVTESQ